MGNYKKKKNNNPKDKNPLIPVTRGMKRFTLEEYLERFKLFPHAKDYTVLSKFKFFTQKCLAQYRHDTCGTKFIAKPRLFELGESLCPKCSLIKDESSTTIEDIPWEKAPKTIPVRVLKARRRAIWLEKRAAKAANIAKAKAGNLARVQADKQKLETENTINKK